MAKKRNPELTEIEEKLKKTRDPKERAVLEHQRKTLGAGEEARSRKEAEVTGPAETMKNIAKDNKPTDKSGNEVKDFNQKIDNKAQNQSNAQMSYDVGTGAATSNKDVEAAQEKATDIYNSTETPKPESQIVAEALPTTEMNEVEKVEAESIGWDGKSIPSQETQAAAQETVNKLSQEEQDEMAKSKLGGWEKLAIALTVLSFAAASLTGGEILPINLIGLTGVDKRLAEMHKANAELDKFNRIKEQWNASGEKKKGMSLEQYTALVGRASRNITEEGGAETNQSELELTKQERELAGQLQLIDAQGNWDMNKLKAQLNAAASEGRLSREQQLALANLNNSSNERIANTAMVGNVLSSAFGGISGLLGVLKSDKNSKVVKHTYIPKEKRGY